MNTCGKCKTKISWILKLKTMNGFKQTCPNCSEELSIRNKYYILYIMGSLPFVFLFSSLIQDSVGSYLGFFVFLFTILAIHLCTFTFGRFR